MEYILGFDLNRNVVRLFDPVGGSYEELPVHKALTVRGDYAAILKYAFRDRNLGGATVRAVLPDTAVACDFFTIPAIKKSMKDAMKIEFENIYTNQNDLKYNSVDYNSGTNYCTNMYVIARKSLLEGVGEGVKAVGGNLKGITFSPNGVANAFLALGGKTTATVAPTSGGLSLRSAGASLFKKKQDKDTKQLRNPPPPSVLYVDVQKYVTRLVLASKSMTTCSLFQPFGYSVFYPNKVAQEYMLTNHDVAELAVLNAIETAKRKKQTVAIASDLTDEEDDADEDYMSMLDALSNKDAAPLPRKKKEEEDDSAEFFEDPEEKKQETAAIPSEPKPFDKIAKKTEKKYPKFMQRDRPADAEGFVMENFRIIQKYILLFVQNMESSTVLARPERVVLNVPPEYAYIVSRLNEEEDNGIEFALLENRSGISPTAMDNLDLYGASLMDKYNKVYNF